MIYMDTMAGPGLMGIVVPMGQRQQRKYKGENPVTMNRYLSRFDALCNWYTSYLQATPPCTSRGPRVQETASGDTPDPVVQKMNELFYNNVENFKENLRAESSVSASQGIFLWPCPSSNHITSYFGYCTPPKQEDSSDHKVIDIGACRF